MGNDYSLLGFRWCLVAGYYEIKAEYVVGIRVTRFGRTVSCQHADARNKVIKYIYIKLSPVGHLKRFKLFVLLDNAMCMYCSFFFKKFKNPTH